MARGDISIIRTFCQQKGNLRTYIFNNISYAIDQNGTSIPVNDNSIFIDPLIITSFIVSDNKTSLRVVSEICGCDISVKLELREPIDTPLNQTCVKAIPNNGTPLYTYEWFVNGIAYQVTNPTNPILCGPIGELAGFVEVIVTDSKGCKSNRIGILTPLAGSSKYDELTISIKSNDVNTYISQLQLIRLTKDDISLVNSPICNWSPDFNNWVNFSNNNLLEITATIDNNIYEINNRRSLQSCTSIPYPTDTIRLPEHYVKMGSGYFVNNGIIVAASKFGNNDSGGAILFYLRNVNRPNAHTLMYSIQFFEYFAANNFNIIPTQNSFVRHGNKMYYIFSLLDGELKDVVIELNIVNNIITSHKIVKVSGISKLIFGGFLTSTKFGLLAASNISIPNGLGGFNDVPEFNYISFNEVGYQLKLESKQLINKNNIVPSVSYFSTNKI